VIRKLKNNLIIKNITQLVTCSGFEAKKGKSMNDLNIINDGCVIIKNGIIEKVGKTKDILSHIDVSEYIVMDLTGKTMLPGFVDSHTHFIFGGYREDEFGMRLRGKSYMEIMEKGGGIIRSVNATKNASKEELYEMGKKRLDEMLEFGITTVEGKSGYGLDHETEIKQLEVMKDLNSTHPIDIVSTFLGAHAVPSEYKNRENEFIDFLIDEVLPEISKRNLAEFCDIFCEKNVFDLKQSEKMLKAGRKYNLKPKIHADEIYPLGGAGLAADINAISADHLLNASDEDIKKMAKNNVIATLLPLTAFSLKENYARARYMIDNNCAVALATDLNPGSCFSNSIPLMIAISSIYMKMTPEETITALTINGAAALDRANIIGSIDPGKKADFVILKYPSYEFLTYNFGVNIVETVIKNGKIVFQKGEI
jgi:imidazolonepropionase